MVNIVQCFIKADTTLFIFIYCFNYYHFGGTLVYPIHDIDIHIHTHPSAGADDVIHWGNTLTWNTASCSPLMTLTLLSHFKTYRISHVFANLFLPMDSENDLCF